MGTNDPSEDPTSIPSQDPTNIPTMNPTFMPSFDPTYRAPIFNLTMNLIKDSTVSNAGNDSDNFEVSDLFSRIEWILIIIFCILICLCMIAFVYFYSNKKHKQESNEENTKEIETIGDDVDDDEGPKLSGVERMLNFDE